MGDEQTSLAEMRVHMEYMRKTVQSLHDRLDGMATTREVSELKDEVDQLRTLVEQQSEMMRALVALERFAKWLAVIAAAGSAVWGLLKILKGGG
jgi:uncharacterized membrane protein YjjP (DUF1212 family)